MSLSQCRAQREKHFVSTASSFNACGHAMMVHHASGTGVQKLLLDGELLLTYRNCSWMELAQSRLL